MAEEFKLTGSCERCRKTDGRSTSAYEIKGRTAEFCDECAEITKGEHDIKPASAQRNTPATGRPAKADAGKNEPSGEPGKNEPTERGTSAALGGGETQVPNKG